MSSRYLLLPFAAQALCMAFDEFYFHRRRRLPLWERIGHPFDTLTILLCWATILFFRPTKPALVSYVILSAFSCLFVTKDEWAHKIFSSAAENWLHALLFALHPLVLLSGGLLWPTIHQEAGPVWLSYEGFERNFFLLTMGLTLLFGLYQLTYWNFYEHKKRQQ